MSLRVDEKEEVISRSWHFRGSRKLKPRALSLYVGDGHRAAVEAIGDFHLYLPSRLDGFVNHFENDNLISVFKNNMIYFNVIPRDDIYEIVMSSSNTNESSMYAVTNKRAKINLDSALLWHCHLGHINKKHIEKLQHDGLLDSTNIKSFENMLLIMPRQGAYYFVTFTDDFSRYGYVYLLKHKHEVSETFKVFQKEVENQLGKTIKSLLSDRGGYPKEMMGYSFYYPPENKIFVARNAEFLKNNFINHEASESLEDLKVIQEKDTHLSLDTSLNHKEDDQETDKPQRDLGEPTNYKAALLDLKSDKWLNAMNVKMQSMKDNEVWELVELPPGAKTIGHK
nr:hypothetical protein [Tanacetum cinerariifolium]